MPFKKLGNDQYQGPSGKKFNYNQVKLYYSLGGHFPGQAGTSSSKPTPTAPKSKKQKKPSKFSMLGGIK